MIADARIPEARGAAQAFELAGALGNKSQRRNGFALCAVKFENCARFEGALAKNIRHRPSP
jgi:hypothetical protein